MDGKKTIKFESKKIGEEENLVPQQLFPDVFIISKLIIDNSFPLIKLINIEDSIVTSENFLDIKISTPKTKQKIDLFLFVNKVKTDMFYQIGKSKYTFKNIQLKNGKNLIEVFYRIGNKKSTSVYSLIIKE
ncbi:MAG: hypothetical protein ABI550_06015 [Ignavibacteriaceae bacterium]